MTQLPEETFRPAGHVRGIAGVWVRDGQPREKEWKGEVLWMCNREMKMHSKSFFVAGKRSGRLDTGTLGSLIFLSFLYVCVRVNVCM